MLAITSISPFHINNGIQQKAVNSWKKLGMSCSSFNHSSEITFLKDYKGVNFVVTEKTMQHVFKKPYVSINAMLGWAKEQNEEHFCLINSDIELDFNKHLLQKIKLELDKDKVVIAHRNDYIKNKKAAQPYVLGIDVFFLNKKHLEIFPPSLFCMGNCHWDYNMPFTALKNDIEVINLQNTFAYHKKHDVQYSAKNWEATGRYFAQEHGIDCDNIGRLTELVFNFLNLNIKKVFL